MFRFTIRDVLWLTLLVGMGIGWLLSARSWLVANQTLTEENRALQAQVNMAKDQADEAWAAAHDPFHQPNPLDDVYRSRRRAR